MIENPLGQPLRILDGRFAEPAEFADLGPCAFRGATAHRANGARISAELLRYVDDDLGLDRGCGGWEAPDDLEGLQEQRETQSVRAGFEIVQM